MTRIAVISLLSVAIVLVVVGALLPVLEGSTITTVYRICPLH